MVLSPRFGAGFCSELKWNKLCRLVQKIKLEEELEKQKKNKDKENIWGTCRGVREENTIKSRIKSLCPKLKFSNPDHGGNL